MSTLEVWFDGDCPLCRREIAVMRRLDRRGAIVFTDVADGAGDCPIDRAELLARFHAREEGVMLSGAAAFAAMWRAIPLLRPLGLAARNRTILGFLERLYMAFLKVRPALTRALRRSGRDSKKGPPGPGGDQAARSVRPGPAGVGGGSRNPAGEGSDLENHRPKRPSCSQRTLRSMVPDQPSRS